MPKIVDHDQYRKELLSKCLSVIAEKGYAAITMRQIAQGLKVSTGTLYHYFPSKDSLFDQLVEYISYQDTSEEAIAQICQLPTLGERLDAIFNFVAEHEDYFLHQALMLVDFSRQKSRNEINQHETLKRAGERYEKALMQMLEIENSTIIVMLINLFDGLIIRRLYQGDRISFTCQTQLLKELLTSYLKEYQSKSSEVRIKNH